MQNRKSIVLSSQIEVVSDWSSFSEEKKALLESAKIATKTAYAPYSNFKVGAAVLLDNGTIVPGNNQENAAYPNGLCAERVALFNASASHPEQAIKAIALTIDFENNKVNEPVFPCGGCRQSILEYEDRWKNDIEVLVIGPDDEVVIISSIKDLLPLSFTGAYLSKTK